MLPCQPMTHQRPNSPKAAHPQFVTCTVLGNTPLFSLSEPAQIVIDCWRTMQQSGRLNIYGYVIMEDYLHLIASAADLPKEVRFFKAATASQILQLLQSPDLLGMAKRLKRFQNQQKSDPACLVWQDGGAAEILLNHDLMRKKLDYMHNNPVKRGYVASPTEYRFSSARDYAGQPGLLPVMTDW
jgi:putative transposase